MKQLRVFQAEWLKLRHSKITWVSFVAFAIAPTMGGIFMLILNDPKAVEQASALSAKAQLMGFESNWESYVVLLTQAVSVGGVLIFGFVAAWLFGREYTEGTAKDLLALPSSRASILHAKFGIYTLWCLALAISNLLLGLLIGLILQLPTPDSLALGQLLAQYFLTTFLTLALGTPVALFALWGKGYLVPLGFVALTLVFSQVIAATGYGYYFPWSVPGLFSGAGGEYKAQLNGLSFTLLGLTSIAGYFATIAYWKYADQA